MGGWLSFKGGGMCGLCGILGNDSDWADQWQLADPAELARFRRNERRNRVKYLNQVLKAFSCSVSDWQGTAYVLSTFTGKTEIVESLSQLWAGVERLSGYRADPLSEQVQAHLQTAR
jgi:hypothetical protein